LAIPTKSAEFGFDLKGHCQMNEHRNSGRTVYLNGEWLPENEAKVSIFDRGFLFADAIYEVTAVVDGKIFDFKGHSARLRRSLDMLGIAIALSERDLLDLHKQIARRNRMTEGLIYLQISRGVQDRNFLIPDDLCPTVTMFTQAKSIRDNPKLENGIAVRTSPDRRWALRQIKSTQLLYSSLEKTESARQGFDDVLFVEDGYITEGGSANFHVMTANGTLVTRQLSNALLHGTARRSILDIARAIGLRTEERALTPDEAKDASEAFITDSVNLLMPVVSIDRQQVGSGKPGPVSIRLRDLYIADRLANGDSIAE
jgi:D-amino acid aminotransferase